MSSLALTVPFGETIATYSEVSFVIFGEPASKANQRKLVTINDRPAIIKSRKARDYVKLALMQIPMAARLRLKGPVEVEMRIYYASERPDLDESVVLDVLQDQWSRVGEVRVLSQAGVYRNDRQVRVKIVRHGIDKVNPRCEVWVRALQDQQGELL